MVVYELFSNSECGSEIQESAAACSVTSLESCIKQESDEIECSGKLADRIPLTTRVSLRVNGLQELSDLFRVQMKGGTIHYNYRLALQDLIQFD